MISRMWIRIIRFVAMMIFAVSYYGFNIEALKLVGALIFVFYIIPFAVTCIFCNDDEDWFDGELAYHTDENGDTVYQLRIYDIYDVGKYNKLILRVDDEIIKDYKEKE